MSVTPSQLSVQARVDAVLRCFVCPGRKQVRHVINGFVFAWLLQSTDIVDFMQITYYRVCYRSPDAYLAPDMR